jgi:hypothetical protein
MAETLGNIIHFKEPYALDAAIRKIRAHQTNLNMAAARRHTTTTTTTTTSRADHFLSQIPLLLKGEAEGTVDLETLYTETASQWQLRKLRGIGSCTSTHVCTSDASACTAIHVTITGYIAVKRSISVPVTIPFGAATSTQPTEISTRKRKLELLLIPSGGRRAILLDDGSLSKVESKKQCTLSHSSDDSEGLLNGKYGGGVGGNDIARDKTEEEKEDAEKESMGVKKEDSLLLNQKCWKCCKCSNNLAFRQYTSSPQICYTIQGKVSSSNPSQERDRVLRAITLLPSHTLLAPPDVPFGTRLRVPGLLRGSNFVTTNRQQPTINTTHKRSPRPKDGLPGAAPLLSSQSKGGGTRISLLTKSQNSRSNTRKCQVEAEREELRTRAPLKYYCAPHPEDDGTKMIIPLFLHNTVDKHSPTSRDPKYDQLPPVSRGRGRRRKISPLSFLTMSSPGLVGKIENTILPQYGKVSKDYGICGDDKTVQGDTQKQYKELHGIIPVQDWRAFLTRLRLTECVDGRIENMDGESIGISGEEVCQCNCCVKRSQEIRVRRKEKQDKSVYYDFTMIRKKQKIRAKNRKMRVNTRSTVQVLGAALRNGQRSTIIPAFSPASTDQDKDECHTCCECSDTQSIHVEDILRQTRIETTKVPLAHTHIKPIRRRHTKNGMGGGESSSTVLEGPSSTVSAASDVRGPGMPLPALSPSPAPSDINIKKPQPSSTPDSFILHVCTSGIETGIGNATVVCFGGTVCSHAAFAEQCRMSSSAPYGGINMPEYTIKKVVLKDAYLCNKTGFIHICTQEACTFHVTTTSGDTVCPFSGKILSQMMLVDKYWKMAGVSASSGGDGGEFRGFVSESVNNDIVYDWATTLNQIRIALMNPLLSSNELDDVLMSRYPINKPGVEEYLAVAMIQTSKLFSSDRFENDISEMRKILDMVDRSITKNAVKTGKVHTTYFRERIEAGYSHLFEQNIVNDPTLFKAYGKKKISICGSGSGNTALPTNIISDIIFDENHDRDDIRQYARDIMKPDAIAATNRRGGGGNKQPPTTSKTVLVVNGGICHRDGISDEVMASTYVDKHNTCPLDVGRLSTIPQLSKIVRSIAPEHIADLRLYYPRIYRSLVTPVSTFATPTDLLTMRTMQLHELSKRKWPVALNLSGKKRARLIEVYAKQVVQFWCMIRQVTRRGQTNPDDFPFTNFVTTALFIFARGIIIPSRFSPDREKEIVELPDLLLAEILPRKGASFILRHRESILAIERNVFDAIINTVSLLGVPPSKLGFHHITIENAPHNLFISLRRNGSTTGTTAPSTINLPTMRDKLSFK